MDKKAKQFVAQELVNISRYLVEADEMKEAGCEKLPEGGMRDNCEKKKKEKGSDKEAGCEKLPEGGMRDNCEKKKNEKSDDKEASLKQLVAQELVNISKYLVEADELKLAARDGMITNGLRDGFKSAVNKFIDTFIKKIKTGKIKGPVVGSWMDKSTLNMVKKIFGRAAQRDELKSYPSTDKDKKLLKNFTLAVRKGVEKWYYKEGGNYLKKKQMAEK